MTVWGFLGVAILLIAVVAVGILLENKRYEGPIEFQFDGETFIWVIDPEAERPFGRRRYEHGSFQYADGTPVTDHRLHRMLQDVWVERQRRAESSDIVS